VQKGDPDLAERIEPLVQHLRDWDCRVTADSTAATLCEAWYEELYESDYPSEELQARYANNAVQRLAALDRVAEALERLHGAWKVPFGRIHRLQRRANMADLPALRFRDRSASLPCLGVNGAMGVIFTQYFTPSIHIPLGFLSQKKRYVVVGAAYLAVYEFAADGVRGRSVVPYGASGDLQSPHYFDQAELFSAARMKPIPFTEQEVLASAVRSYHPGQEPRRALDGRQPPDPKAKPVPAQTAKDE
jgi:acyl-homoserine lactone acylase PvdQ